MLEYLNALLILIILGVTIVNTVMIVKTRRQLDNLKDLERRVDYEIRNMRDEVGNMVRAYLREARSIVDLAEFKNLDEKTKQHYKYFIVQKIMPLVMVEINRRVKDSGMNEFLTMYKKEITDIIDTEFTKAVNTAGQ